MKAIIAKSYARKLSANYSSEEFVTRVEKEIEYNTKEEYLAENDKLAAQVKSLTQRDIERHSELLRTTAPNSPIMTEDRTV